MTDAKHKTVADVPLGTLGEVSSVCTGLAGSINFLSQAQAMFRSAEVDVGREQNLHQALFAVRNARQLLEHVEKDLRVFAHKFDSRLKDESEEG